MGGVISPLQRPHQQELSPEFPSQEISCEEALTAQTKSSSAPPSQHPRNCRGGPAGGDGCGQGWRAAGAEGQRAWEDMEGNKEVLLLPLALTLPENYLLTGTCWPSPPGNNFAPSQTELGERKPRELAGLLVDLHPEPL